MQESPYADWRATLRNGRKPTDKDSDTMGNKIVTEADRKRPAKPQPTATYTPPRSGQGQKGSQERGTATRNKKNPGKRPKQGG